MASAATGGSLGRDEGPKAILRRLLSNAKAPLTSSELWVVAEPEGLKSKRHMKQMLAQMKSSRQVVTKPMGRNLASRHRARSHGYALPHIAEEWAASRLGGVTVLP